MRTAQHQQHEMMEMDDHELPMFSLDTRLTRCQQKGNVEKRVDAAVKDFRFMRASSQLTAASLCTLLKDTSPFRPIYSACAGSAERSLEKRLFLLFLGNWAVFLHYSFVVFLPTHLFHIIMARQTITVSFGAVYIYAIVLCCSRRVM
jgi:hypothetical protein